MIGDFGIATFAHSVDSWEGQRLAGSWPYMAPEHIMQNAQPASDQYSLAIVVYEWLCGTRPFTGNITQLMYQHLGVPPPSLCRKNPGIPSEVEQVVMKALAKDPSQRFENIEVFAASLAEVHKSIESPKPSTNAPLPIYSDFVNGMMENIYSPNDRSISHISSHLTIHDRISAERARPVTYAGHSSLVTSIVWSPDASALLLVLGIRLSKYGMLPPELDCLPIMVIPKKCM